MSIADKVAFTTEVSDKLLPDMLKTSDGKHPYSEENILSVALGALIADDRNECERITGFYGGGYQSELRKVFITVRETFLSANGERKSDDCTI